jgi:hypothetical protein
MRVLNINECLTWLKGHGFVGSESLGDLIGSIPCSKSGILKYPFPKDSGKKVVLARLLFQLLKSDTNFFVLIRNWNVWPSSGHIPLLLRLREALGSDKPLDEYPGHLFSENEGNDVISTLVLSLQFNWDCLLVGDNVRIACFISHDEHFFIMSANDALLKKCEDILKSGKIVP